MAEQITLGAVADLTQTTTAQNTINTNSTTIQNAFLDVLSLSGVAPNQMQSVLDMNSQQIINLPNPITANSPVRLQDISTLNGGGIVTNIPSGGNTGQILTKTSNSNYAVGWTSQAAGLVAGTNINISGGSPATVSTVANPTFSVEVVTPIINNGGNINVPSATDTFVLRNTTDTLTNKTLSSSTSNITLGGNAVSASTGTGNLVFATSPNLTTPSIATGTPNTAGTLGYSSGVLTFGDGATNHNVISADQVQTLTNKTISGSNNTLSVLGASQISGNIPVTNLNSGTSAGITTFWRGDGTWSAPPSGSYVFLETLTASNSTTLPTVASWTGYSAIELIFTNIIPATSGVLAELQLQKSSSYQATNYASTGFTTNSTSIITVNTSTAIGLCNTASLINSGAGLSGTIRIYGPNISGSQAFTGHFMYTVTGPTDAIWTISGYQSTAATATGAQLLMSSGNITSGTIKVYGIV